DISTVSDMIGTDHLRPSRWQGFPEENEMSKATHTPSAVAQSIVRAGRSYVTAREAAAAASADYRAAAILTCEALRTGVTAKDVSAALVTEVNGDRTLKAEVQT